MPTSTVRLLFGDTAESICPATTASIIASQALISGSFTLISEGISLGFWPRVKTKYPTDVRGQIYIPSINWILFTGCVLVVLYFKTSTSMTAAYGFSITVAMLMTTILIFYFLRYVKRYPFWIVGAIITVFVCVDSSKGFTVSVNVLAVSHPPVVLATVSVSEPAALDT